MASKDIFIYKINMAYIVVNVQQLFIRKHIFIIAANHILGAYNKNFKRHRSHLARNTFTLKLKIT